MSRRDDLNALACLRFAHEFSRNGVYALARKRENRDGEKHTPATGESGRVLFSNDVSHAKLASLIAGGANTRQTRLTEEFDYDQLAAKPNLIPLLAWSSEQELQVASGDEQFRPAAGWTVLSLEPAEQQTKEKSDA